MAATRINSAQQFRVAADLDFLGFKGINVGLCTSANEIANKAYVDAMFQGRDEKPSGLVATNGVESYTIVGGAVTQIAGTQIDGVAPPIGARILIKNAPAATGAGLGLNTANTNNPANGIYEVTGNTTNLTLVRSFDANTSEKVTAGMFIFISEGTNSADNGYVLITNDTITLNTSPLLFTQSSGAGQINAGAGMTKDGNTINIGTASTARIVVNADNIDLATVTPTGTASAAIRRIDFDAYGRVAGVINANASDVISTIGSQAANTVLAAPNGSSGNTSFRLLVAADIPNLDAAKITTGTLPIARGGTGRSDASWANGQILIGAGTATPSLALLSGEVGGIGINPGAGTIQITNLGVRTVAGTTNQVLVNGAITAAAGTITLSLPQAIHTGATPTFAGITFTAGTVAVSTPYKTATQTWNAGAVNFVGQVYNITDTASAAASRHFEYQISGTPVFSLRKDGTITTGIWGGTAIAATVGGTGQTVYAVGDILFASTTTALSRLAAAAADNVLISGTTPSWGKASLTAHVSGILPMLNGGTNRNDALWANGQILIGNGTATPALATITGSATINVANTAGVITLTAVTGATGVVTAPNVVVGEVPSGTVNGINPTFTLASTPLANTLALYVNGVRQKVGAGNDYTLSGNVVTFIAGAIPQTDEPILADYLK